MINGTEKLALFFKAGAKRKKFRKFGNLLIKHRNNVAVTLGRVFSST
jgi:hypothetical protein